MPTIVRSRWLAVVVCTLAGFAAAQDRSRIWRDARADGGTSVPVNLDAIAKEQEHMKRSVASRVDAAIEKLQPLIDRPVDAGLPACRFSGKRTYSRAALAPEVRGLTLAFVTASSLMRLRERYHGAIVLLARADSLSDGARADGLATRELADALGVECVPAVATISPEGDRVHVVYGE